MRENEHLVLNLNKCRIERAAVGSQRGSRAANQISQTTLNECFACLRRVEATNPSQSLNLHKATRVNPSSELNFNSFIEFPSEVCENQNFFLSQLRGCTLVRDEEARIFSSPQCCRLLIIFLTIFLRLCRLRTILLRLSSPFMNDFGNNELLEPRPSVATN